MRRRDWLRIRSSHAKVLEGLAAAVKDGAAAAPASPARPAGKTVSRV